MFRAETYTSLFEVVEHAFFENEPAPMLGLVLPSFLCQPPFSLWVEECLCQPSLAIRYLELLLLDILIEFLGVKKLGSPFKALCKPWLVIEVNNCSNACANNRLTTFKNVE